MFSEFLKRKMTLGFYRMDLSRDGYLDADDFRLLSQRIAEINQIEPGTEAYDRIFTTYEMAWKMYFSHADLDGDGRVSCAEFIESSKQMVSADNFEEVGLAQNDRQFAAIDTDDDGLIQVNEFGAFLSAAGVHKDDIQFAFNKLDSDGDGVISKQEFSAALHAYFTSEDINHPGNWFFGPF